MEPPQPAATTRLLRARLADQRLVDLTIADGRVVAIDPSADVPSADTAAAAPTESGVPEAFDLDGWLVVPALAEWHAHLDKALTADLVPNQSGDLFGAIDAWIAASDRGLLTTEGMTERAVRTLGVLIDNGVTRVRTHVNVGAGNGSGSIEAVRRAASEFAGLIDLEIVALVASPITGAAGAGNRAALVEAIEAGVDLVGGCPHLEDDPEQMITDVLDLAAQAGIGLDLHIDETLDPNVLTLVSVARQVLDSAIGLPVTASHCVSLSMVPIDRQEAIAELVCAAGIDVVALPQTNLFLQGRDHPVGTPRGVTPISVLQAAGVTVGAGGDNVQDPFNPMGRADPLETANLLVTVSHLDPLAALSMVTATRSAIPAVGDPAHLLALDAGSVREALASPLLARRVLRGGQLVASTDVVRQRFSPRTRHSTALM